LVQTVEVELLGRLEASRRPHLDADPLGDGVPGVAVPVTRRR
jgi:hypothetical protein